MPRCHTRIQHVLLPASCRLVAIALSLTSLVLGLAVAVPAQAAPLADPPNPIPLNFLNWSGITPYGTTAPAWYFEAGGVVHLQGAASQLSSSGQNANHLGNLPPQASPGRNVFTIAHAMNGTYADVMITAAGEIWLIDPRPPAVKDYSFVSLESITFYVGAVSGGIELNGTNWSPTTTYNSPAPSAMEINSITHLSGSAIQTSSNGSNADLLGTINQNVAPVKNVFVIAHTMNGTYADIMITTGGQIWVIDPRPLAVKDYSFVSLEGITFVSTNLLNPIAIQQLNNENWSGTTNFGAMAPGWFKSGVVHLEGAVTQLSGNGQNANLVGTLPSTVAPSRNVFTIAHTNDGTYADVMITTTGQIWLIDPRPRAVKDYSFVSLEGITYSP